MEQYSLALFRRGTEIAAEKGLILVDTKYEFGNKDNKIYLIDEIHTPALYLGAGAGTQVTASASDLNKTTALTNPTAATPVNSVAASKVLAISGVVIDGETITINGVDIYEKGWEMKL